MFNEKGQASSVFNILIAGVIALAILGILMGLLGGVFNIQGKPIDTAQDMLKTAYSTPFTIHKSGQAVVFNKDDVLTARAVAQATSGLIPEQIAFSIGERTIAFFEVSNFGTNATLTFTSPSAQESKLAAYCDYAENVGTELFNLTNEAVEVLTPCYDLTDNRDFCCVIYPVRPN